MYLIRHKPSEIKFKTFALWRSRSNIWNVLLLKLEIPVSKELANERCQRKWSTTCLLAKLDITTTARRQMINYSMYAQRRHFSENYIKPERRWFDCPPRDNVRTRHKVHPRSADICTLLRTVPRTPTINIRLYPFLTRRTSTRVWLPCPRIR